MLLRRLGLTIPLLAALIFSGCGKEPTSVSGGRMSVCSGLPPVAFLVAAIGGERVESRSILSEGRSPHDFSPGPREIRGIVSSKLFFTTGMEFEHTLVRVLDPERTRVVDATAGVERIPFDNAGSNEFLEHHGEFSTHGCGSAESPHAGEFCASDHDHSSDHDHASEHDHESAHICDSSEKDSAHGSSDPHVWLSAHNAIIMAENIAKALTEADPAGGTLYAANLDALKRKLWESGEYAKRSLAPYAGREFYVYHPAFGYYAKMVDLRQEAIELGGREATPKRLSEIIKRALANHVKVVFVQPGFNPNSARALGEAIGGKVAQLDALAADIPANFRAMTDALLEGFASEERK